MERTIYETHKSTSLSTTKHPLDFASAVYPDSPKYYNNRHHPDRWTLRYWCSCYFCRSSCAYCHGTIASTILWLSALQLLRSWLPSQWFSVYPQTLFVRSPTLRSFGLHLTFAWYPVRQACNRLAPIQRQLTPCMDLILHCSANTADRTTVAVRSHCSIVRNWRCWWVLRM